MGRGLDEAGGGVDVDAGDLDAVGPVGMRSSRV